MKNLPKSFQIKLFNNSVNEQTSKEAAGPYNVALKENGHDYTLNYTPNHTRPCKANPKTEEYHQAEPKTLDAKEKRKELKNKENNMF